jgi:hypothetical protein
MILSTHGILQSGGVVIVPPLLDIYPSAAAAYSLRLLRTDYTGSAIRVRRTDLVESDIGFTSTGALDTAALLAFTGTGALDNGFVKTWYDQSGNARNATQATAANQPQIVSGGSVILNNGKPSIDHIGTTDLKLSANFTIGNTYSMYGVVKFDGYARELFGASTGSYGIYQDASTTFYHNGGSVGTGSGTTFGLNFSLLSIYRNATRAISMYKNTTIMGSSFNLGSNSNFILRSLSGEELSLYNLDGRLSEAIFYQTYEISNQTGIEGNIKTYYGL